MLFHGRARRAGELRSRPTEVYLVPDPNRNTSAGGDAGRPRHRGCRATGRVCRTRAAIRAYPRLGNGLERNDFAALIPGTADPLDDITAGAAADTFAADGANADSPRGDS